MDYREGGGYSSSLGFENMSLYDEWACLVCTYSNNGGRTACEMCGTARQRQEYMYMPQPAFPDNHYHGTNQTMPSAPPDKERRIVMIGKTGSGKSSTCNNIIGQQIFKSESSSVSVTRECQRATRDRFDRNIQIIDTPGLFDTGMSNGETTREIVKCIGITAPGPHAFVFILPVGRFTKEEQDTVEHFRHVFGDGMMKYFLILFTKKDELIYDGKSIEQYLQTAPQGLKDLLNSCGNRYIAFNNRGPPQERDRDVQALVNLIDSIYLNNGGKCYTSEMYKEAEKSMKKREEELRRQHEAKANQEKMRIQQMFEQKMKAMEKAQAEKIAKLQKELKAKEADRDNRHEKEKLKLELEKEKLKMEKELEMERRRMELEAHKKKMEIEQNAPNYREDARKEVSDGSEKIMSVMKFIGPIVLELLTCVGKEKIKDMWSSKDNKLEVKTHTELPSDSPSTDVKRETDTKTTTE